MGDGKRLRARVYEALEVGLAGRGPLRWVHAGVILLILANVAAVVLESDREIVRAWGEAFRRFELFSVVVFTAEYLLRVWAIVEHPRYRDMPAWRARLAYVGTPLALVDLAAILPFYLAFAVAWDLRFLRILRLLRLLKLGRYFPGVDLFLYVLRAQLPALAAASLVMVVLVLVSASVMYYLENPVQPEVFSSIGASVWWSVVTLTTVGYGDMMPLTAAGRVLGILIMLMGVGVVALPAAMLAARFGDEIQARRVAAAGGGDAGPGAGGGQCPHCGRPLPPAC